MLNKTTKGAKLAVAFNEEIKKAFPEGSVSVEELLVACGSIVTSYVMAIESVKDRRDVLADFIFAISRCVIEGEKPCDFTLN